MTNRRNFLHSLAAAGGMALIPSVYAGSRVSLSNQDSSLLKLHSLVPEPVIIKSIELLYFDNEYILRVTSDEGLTGCTLCNQRMPELVSLLQKAVIPHFLGKDARDIESLLEYVYVVNSNYKYTGLPFWNCVGHLEISIFDLLGKVIQKPVHYFLGKSVCDNIEVYISSTTRETTPQQETANFAKRLAETGAKAVKFKVGGRMSKNADAMPGRSDTIVPLMRNTLGESITFYVDANGSYDTANGLRMAQYLEEQKVAIFEEPVPFDEYENTRLIKQALKTLKIAGGEQDTSLYRFGWLAANRALDVLQPDLYYNGGFIRCLKVAKMAANEGIKFSPHSPKTNPLAAPMLHLMAVVQNTGGYQEWHISYPNHKNWYTPHYEIKDGKIAVPDQPGLGISFDNSIWAKAETVKC